jgi:hypothetical protein
MVFETREPVAGTERDIGGDPFGNLSTSDTRQCSVPVRATSSFERPRKRAAARMRVGLTLQGGEKAAAFGYPRVRSF